MCWFSIKINFRDFSFESVFGKSRFGHHVEKGSSIMTFNRVDFKLDIPALVMYGSLQVVLVDRCYHLLAQRS